MYTNEPIYRLTVNQYHDLINAGSLTADDPVELLEGALVFKTPKNPPHVRANKRAARVISRAIPKRFHYQSQDPVTLDDGEPEPDGAIVRGDEDDFSSALPGPNDVALVLEISDSTLDRDRGIKLRSYARAGIACYWIINLVDGQIEVYTQPDNSAVAPTYRQMDIFKPGQTVPLIIDGQTVAQLAVSDLLPAE